MMGQLLHNPVEQCRCNNYIEATSLSFDYGTPTTHVLRDISFSVARGEFVSLLGPSGCGKTTLLRLLAGFAKPRSGALLVGGCPAWSLPRDGRIALVHQRPVLLPWRTAFANVGLPGEVLGRSREDAKTEAYLDLVALAHAKTLLPRQMSGGMLSRLALARALAQEPETLLLDEPFSSLDEPNRETLYDCLSAIWRERRTTTVMVTHRPEEALFMSDRVLVLGGAPATVHAVVEVVFSRPRPLQLLDSPEFLAALAVLRAKIRSNTSLKT
jgi:NitT/TauT family transport system ATP-binding protein